MTASRFARTALSAAAGAGIVFGLSGCNNAGEGAFAGAALGALSGLAIGSLSGNAGDGAAIGAVSGALIGGVIGDQNERNARSGYPQRTVVYEERHYYEGHRCDSHCHHHHHRDPWWDDDCHW